MQKYLTESIIEDILDGIEDGIDELDDLGLNFLRSNKVLRSGSISKATKDLILVFPHLCTQNISFETARMLTKAIETKAASLLQIAFSAYNITSHSDAVGFISQFHNNIGADKISLDTFIDFMDSQYNSLGESYKYLNGIDKATLTKALNELKQMDFYFEEDSSEYSINERFVVNETYGKYSITEKSKKIVKEAIYDEDEVNVSRLDFKNDKSRFDMFRQQLTTTDVKKANELVPTMMTVNFVTVRRGGDCIVNSTAVIGVKAKLYPASSDDIINKIILKHTDNNVLLKLIKVSTKEISFIRDFLLAIDNAKLTALSTSKNGSDTNRFLKILERRAVYGKVRKKLNIHNSFKAITTITLSKEEADYVKQYHNINLYNPAIIRKIMESLNIMMFIIADDTEESALIIMDSGEDTYEKYSYTHLDRESADGSYKKAINLMSKVVR